MLHLYRSLQCNSIQEWYIMIDPNSSIVVNFTFLCYYWKYFLVDIWTDNVTYELRLSEYIRWAVKFAIHDQIWRLGFCMVKEKFILRRLCRCFYLKYTYLSIDLCSKGNTRWSICQRMNENVLSLEDYIGYTFYFCGRENILIIIHEMK